MSASADEPIELIIPRDPAASVPPMTRQNVTAAHGQLFSLHFVNISSALPVSVHIEMRPLVGGVAFLLIYAFDRAPLLNSTHEQLADWSVLCPHANNTTHVHFIDNRKTAAHESLVFGIRQLNTTEQANACSNTSRGRPPVSDQPTNFTGDYELRAFTSGCYYLDAHNNWQAHGLIVRLSPTLPRSLPYSLSPSRST